MSLQRHLQILKMEGKESSIAVLDRAKEILDKNIWIKGAVARTEDGRECSEKSPNACGFCLSGAVAKAVFDLDMNYHINELAHHALTDTLYKEVFQTQINTGYIVTFNDDIAKTKEEVIEIIDKTMESLNDYED